MYVFVKIQKEFAGFCGGEDEHTSVPEQQPVLLTHTEVSGFLRL